MAFYFLNFFIEILCVNFDIFFNFSNVKYGIKIRGIQVASPNRKSIRTNSDGSD